MDKSRFHFRAFARIIRRVEKTGCLKRIRVPLNLTRHKKSKSSSVGLTDKCLARCVKLTREPNVNDWEQTLNVTLKCTAEDADEENGDGVNDGDEEKVDNVDDVDYDAVAKLENTEGDLLEESSRILPSWVADRSLENVIYDAVDAAGIDGVSSMVSIPTILYFVSTKYERSIGPPSNNSWPFLLSPSRSNSSPSWR